VVPGVRLTTGSVNAPTWVIGPTVSFVGETSVALVPQRKPTVTVAEVPRSSRFPFSVAVVVAIALAAFVVTAGGCVVVKLRMAPSTNRAPLAHASK